MLSVAVHLHHEIVVLGQGIFIAGLDGHAVAQIERMGSNLGPGSPGGGGGLIPGTVIDHQNLAVRRRFPHPANHLADAGSLVEGGDDDERLCAQA